MGTAHNNKQRAAAKVLGIGLEKYRKRDVSYHLWYLVNRAKKRSRGSARSGAFGGTPQRPFSITAGEVRGLFASYDGKCALTGMPMTHCHPGERNISLDCIRQADGYVPGNVRLVCSRANTMRGNMSDEELLRWCRAVLDKKPVLYQPTQTPEADLPYAEARARYGVSLRRWRQLRNLPYHMMWMLRNATLRGRHAVEVTTRQLVDLYMAQAGKCAVTGTTLLRCCGTAWVNYSASLDRIDSQKPYELGNIRFTCYRVNAMRANLTDETMRAWCLSLINHNPDWNELRTNGH
jgi:hypothetical protein